MSNSAKKARKKAHRESGYSAETAYEHEPKRPTRKYQTAEERQATRRRQREHDRQADRLTAAVMKLTRTRKNVDEVMER